MPARETRAGECTPVSGIVAGETWTAANSPYCVVGDIFITALTIEAGVVVRVGGPFEIEVAGFFEVNGTCGSPVVFTPLDKTNGWKGLLFRDSVPGSYFNGAIIEGAKLSAVRITSTPPAFTNCVIRDNSSPDYGGGILAYPSAGQTLILDGCIVSNNLANPTPSSGYGYGGGIYVQGSLLLVQTSILNNRSRGSTGYGAGVFAGAGNCTMRNCTIAFNVPNSSSRDDAGGIYFDGGDNTRTLQMNNCIVASNGWANAAADYSGGGVLVWRGSASLLNCLIVGNLHEGVYFRSGRASIINCTVARNDVGHWGIYNYGATVGVTNCIVYYQSGANVSGATCAYSDVQGGIQAGPGNISFAPALCPGNYSRSTSAPSSTNRNSPAATSCKSCA